ncbi:MAG: mandelate racemase/muconate lactonizing enzyme family protein [Candidatus Latescibacterota bacterium]|nr:mandelate racemase/muconate lactonizing enzyme family protein [Candidatus Latescibacterota bacterium]
MKIIDIEAIALRVPYEERIRKAFYHFAMTEELTLYKFHTDTGLIGLGERVGPPFEQTHLEPYLGSDPFDHVMGTGPFNLDMACYDLMGKHLGQPAWKLMGQQRRQWVSMGWWMPCMSPEDSAREVEIAAERGYRGLKCKARAFYDVVEQAEAMQQVAPKDFRIEFDFNGALISVEKALPVLRALEDIPVVKGVEEPIFAYDVEGWRRLHSEVRIPFYLHGVSTIFDGPSRQPSGPWLGLRAGDFDGALCSHENVRNALAASWAFAAANTPILLQYVGTGITSAFACQLGAVMHTATLPGVTASHAYEDDLIAQPLDVHRGFMRIPEGPGLGVELDEDAVARYQTTQAVQWPRHVSIVELPGGVQHYYQNLQQAEDLMKQGVDESFAPGVRLREWEDDGSKSFERIWTDLQKGRWPVWD